MSYYRRVTLRCLCDDLSSDWVDTVQYRAYLDVRKAIARDASDGEIALLLEEVPTPARARHPLIKSFYSSFEADEPNLRRESITGLTDPHWWKQKVSRWRGAATDAAIVGEREVWLCSGGLRAAGESRDFYASFMQAIQSGGPAQYLPGAEDRRYQAVEEKLARYEAWLEQIYLATLVSLHECATDESRRQIHVPVPFPEPIENPLVHFAFDLVRIEEDGTELMEILMTVKINDHGHPNLVEGALDAARCVIEPIAEAWRVLPGMGNDQVWSTYVDREVLGLAATAAQTGLVPDHLRGGVKLGVHAHYTPKDRIVEATVDGDAVRGLCGTWFVPTADPAGVPLCPSCRALHAQLG